MAFTHISDFIPLCRCWRGYLAMNAQQLWNGLRWSPAKTTFSGNSKISDNLLRCCDSPLCTLTPIGVMYQSEIEFCFGVEMQVAQRCKIGIIIAIAGHG